MDRIRIGLLGILVMMLMGGCALCPEPLTLDEIESRAAADLSGAFSDQEPLDGPISLYEAMARAVKYNLDHRTALMEKALAYRQMSASWYDLLPDLVASAGYASRSDYLGSSSMALTGAQAGTESLTMSTSQEKDVATADVTMMWNVLDFGVSYLRAGQQADNYLILEEERRKAVQTIIQDVRYAYWRAQVAECLMPGLTTLLEQTRSALDRAEQITSTRIQPLRISLEYQQALLENIRLLKGLIREMATARSELATLMNLHPGSDYTLEPVDLDSLPVPDTAVSLEELEEIALTQRPELRQEDYKLRISAKEAKKAILEMLPGVSVDFGYNYNSNDFLYANDWTSVGTAVSMNLFNLLSGPADYRAAKAREEANVMRRKALTMAVLTQVHLSYRQFKTIQDEYDVNCRLAGVSDQLQQLVETSAEAGAGDELEVILSRTNFMVARMRRHLVYAELQNAMGRIISTAGIDPAPGAAGSESIEAIAAILKSRLGEVEARINSGQ